MTIEQQVTNLEISKRLKELGVNQESAFYWLASKERKQIEVGKWVPKSYEIEVRRKGFISDFAGSYGYSRYLSAFTVAELGEMLPASIELERLEEKNWYQLTCDKEEEDNSWCVYYERVNEIQMLQVENTEADARGKMLIYLLENKLIAI